MSKKRILCTVCGRGGSKGIVHKNIRVVAGKPLIAHTIDMAKQWGGYDRLVVSSDDEAIINVAKEYGAEVPFVRPSELATDTSGKVAVIRHALESMEELSGQRFDYVVDLDATSPLRTVGDIEAAVAKCIDEELDIVYSVSEARKNPYFNMVEMGESGYPQLCKKLPANVLSRQSAPKVYELNASIYVYERDFLKRATSIFGANRAGIHVMPQTTIDIDEESDLVYLEYLMSRTKE